MDLMEHQVDAIANMRNGCILWGGVGSGKTLTAMHYYVEKEAPKDVYVITTAKKRDDLDWLREGARVGIGTTRETTTGGLLTVDSWNNAHKYVSVKDAFFIFDEQRVVGTGAWVKAFLRIARSNNWILLSATPGDTWMDYAPVFIANGFFKNMTQFKDEHVVYAPYVKFPKILRYVNEGRLIKYKNQILVEMPYTKHTTRIPNYIYCGFDQEKWTLAVRDRWHPFEDRPIIDVAELFRVMRRIVNDDPSRLQTLRQLMTVHPKMIVFYNFNYELDRLRTLSNEITIGEWNGHRKDPIPATDEWLYLVQYTAGSEGWNCIETDAMVLYSLTYSYKNHVQAQGRIDRLDTTYGHLYYYLLVSHAPIDQSIIKSQRKKKNFNEKDYSEGVNRW